MPPRLLGGYTLLHTGKNLGVNHGWQEEMQGEMDYLYLIWQPGGGASRLLRLLLGQEETWQENGAK